MRILVEDGFEDCCKLAADMILETIRNKPNAHVGLATGSSAQGVYPYLVQAYAAGKADFSKVSSINLDEYVGLGPEHPQSYRRFMDENLFNHINIRKGNTYVAKGTGDIDANLAEFHNMLTKRYRDIQLLGIGVNGHIAFNEPGPFLCGGPHLVHLDPSTIEANARFFSDPKEVPREAISMGMEDIMRAKRIVLLAAGESKAKAIAGLVLDERIDTRNPSTMLKMHPDATILLTRKLADRIGYDAKRNGCLQDGIA
ncbi:MAG: glucosamine-6-phosphate deaminase [Candidatus Pelethousia sp.]|nr:glucosamine-6-phosphate deaminase [Candidatus Pelethousia sp.]